jgi:hypothetical protein
MNEETLKGLLRELDELRGKVARLQAQEQGTGGGGGGAVTSVSANASDDVAVSPTTGAVLVSHKNSGVTAGTFNLITVNARGHATFGQLIAYLTGANSPLSVSGGVVSHDNSGVTAGTYNQLTVDGRGHATAGANIFYLTGANSPLNLSGSVVGHATSGVTAGSYTNANLTVNAFGHLTAVSNGSAAAGAVLLNSGGTHQTGADVRLENSTNGATMWVKNTWSFTTASKAIYAEAVEGSAIAAVSGKIAVNAVSSNDVALYASTVNGSSIAQFVGGATGSGQLLILSDGAIISTSYLDAQTNVRLNGLRFIERGSSFPGSPTNGQQIYRTDYRAWFEWVSADAAWRQTTVPTFNNVFPASPVTGLRVFRLDRALEYYYDGARWTTDPRPLTVVPRGGGTDPYAQATTIWDVIVPDFSVNGYVMDELWVAFQAGTVAQSVANHYTIDLRVHAIGAGSSTPISPTSGTANTQNATATVSWFDRKLTYNSVRSTTEFKPQIILTPVGAPGTFRCVLAAKYRLIG